jgi:anti-sigma regulatory factor (Ser/Thr protein kinase)
MSGAEDRITSTPGHEQTDFAGFPKTSYRKMRNRIRLAEPPRRSNGSSQAAGRPTGRYPIARPILDLVIDLAGLAGLRTTVAARASELGAKEVRDDVVIVAHELATNVVRHGGGLGRLRMWREGRRIVCRVSDSGPGMAGLRGKEAPAAGRPGGRGLWIARRLADVRIETGPTGTVVVAALPL